MSSSNSVEGQPSETNYVAYHNPKTHHDQIGHYNLSEKTIQPLSFKSGTPISNLYQVIEAGESNIIRSGSLINSSEIHILPPLASRDVLCVGKNYLDHAKEFNSSGFDSSDKVDIPSHPVIFTKRYTSIIADGEAIYPHTEFTSTMDYEGEIGIIVGKTGFRIKEEDALSHVWGYTIVNDITARERQRDHKQFFMGKSSDTFCPMGPIAVPKYQLDKVLRVRTHVNGELRQDATTEDLIFSIAYLIKTVSEGQTLMPGDVLATGTPAGVGIGRNPPVYLQPGDTVAISVNGLGTLTNRIADLSSPYPIATKTPKASLPYINSRLPVSQLTTIGKKLLFYKSLGPSSSPPIVFVHGLGGTHAAFTPLIHTLGLDYTHACHLFDLEGHGASPTHTLSQLSISSFSKDLDEICIHAAIASGVTIIAHSMGCLVAIAFAIAHPEKVERLILIGPPVLPFPKEGVETLRARAELVRREGMLSIAEKIALSGTSLQSQTKNPLAMAAVMLSLQGQDREGYAKACTALAEAEVLDWGRVQARVTVITGSDDGVAPIDGCRKVMGKLGRRGEMEVLEGVGHWSVFENLEGVARMVERVMERSSVA